MRVRPNLAFVVKTPTRLESRDHMDGIHGVSEKSGDYFAPQKSGDPIFWGGNVIFLKFRRFRKWVEIVKYRTATVSSFNIKKF